MSKVTLNNLANLQNDTTAVNTINNNSDAIEVGFDNTLSRDGTAPNEMEANLDMDSNRILNLPAPVDLTEPARLTELNAVIAGTPGDLPAGGTTGQVLKKNSNTSFDTGWDNSVTSVGLALPSDFSISGSPVTTTGTLTGAWATPPTGTGAMVRAAGPTMTLTNATGLPLSTGVTGINAAGKTWLGNSTSANLAAFMTDETGSGALTFATSPTLATPTLNSPTLVTPALGVATATSINKVALTAPATSATLTIADGKTLTASNSLTLAGTDATVMTFPNTTQSIAGLTATQTLTNKTIDTSTNTIQMNGATVTRGQVPGTGTNDNAAGGYVGEVLSADLTSGSAISLTTNVTANITSITLTAGDWDVFGSVVFTPAATTSQTRLIGSLSTTSATIDATNPFAFVTVSSAAQVTGGQNSQITCGPRRFTVTSTQQVFIVVQALFTASTMTSYGSIRARRVR